ncbi:DUF4221 domain-containing protein [Chitinophaga pinensis]|nr:DUF4221 domain-containing protein [Chitinophaga pinensis]
MKRICYTLTIILAIGFIVTGCNTSSEPPQSTYKYVPPDYYKVGLRYTTDTIHLKLSDSASSKILSLNIFSQKGRNYLASLDKRASLSIYDLGTRDLIKRMVLKDMFFDHDVYHPSAYMLGFDSIFIVNRNRLYLFDTSAAKNRSIEFLANHPSSWAQFEGGNPLAVRDGKYYTSVRPIVKERDIEEVKKWKLLYQFDFSDKTSQLFYNLPDKFQSDIYGSRMLTSSFCINDKGRFVVSLAADTNIYETDLQKYHYSHYAKSCFHEKDVFPVTKKDLLERSAYEKYLTRDSYGAIYFDPVRKRYLRVARQALTEDDYDAFRWNRPQSLVIFDSQFRIIGESSIPFNVRLDQLLITPNGDIYARVNDEDKRNIHFVKLVYYDLASAAR